jgi:hypothetical protein
MIERYKKTIMTTSEWIRQRNPEQCSLEELLEMRAAARALRAEYAAHELDTPEWLPQAESDLDAEIQSQGHFEKLRLRWDLRLEQQIHQAEADR